MFDNCGMPSFKTRISAKVLFVPVFIMRTPSCKAHVEYSEVRPGMHTVLYPLKPTLFNVDLFLPTIRSETRLFYSDKTGQKPAHMFWRTRERESRHSRRFSPQKY